MDKSTSETIKFLVDQLNDAHTRIDFLEANQRNAESGTTDCSTGRMPELCPENRAFQPAGNPDGGLFFSVFTAKKYTDDLLELMPEGEMLGLRQTLQQVSGHLQHAVEIMERQGAA